MDNRTKFKETIDKILNKNDMKKYKESLLTIEVNDDIIEDIFQSLCDHVSNYSSHSDDVLLFDYLTAFIDFLINHSKDISQYIQSILDLLQSHILAFDNIDSELKTYLNIYHHIINQCKNAKEFSNNEQLFKHLIEFALENLSNNYKAFGIECLKELFNNQMFLVQKKKNTKKIWGKVFVLFESNFKGDLLKCLKEFILASQEEFQPYATITLYKALDFLTGNDSKKVSLNALEVIDALTRYCDDEMLSLKENIVDFLTVLEANNKNNKIKDMCLKLLIHFQEFTQKEQKQTSADNNYNLTEFNAEEGEINNENNKNVYYSLKDIDLNIDQSDTIRVDNIHLAIDEKNNEANVNDEVEEKDCQIGGTSTHADNSKNNNFDYGFFDNNEEIQEDEEEIIKQKEAEESNENNNHQGEYNKQFTFKINVRI